jgi:hypothetical protein
LLSFLTILLLLLLMLATYVYWIFLRHCCTLRRDRRSRLVICIICWSLGGHYTSIVRWGVVRRPGHKLLTSLHDVKIVHYFTVFVVVNTRHRVRHEWLYLHCRPVCKRGKILIYCTWHGRFRCSSYVILITSDHTCKHLGIDLLLHVLHITTRTLLHASILQLVDITMKLCTYFDIVWEVAVFFRNKMCVTLTINFFLLTFNFYVSAKLIDDRVAHSKNLLSISAGDCARKSTLRR